MKHAALPLTPDLFVEMRKASTELGITRRFRVKKNALPDDARPIRVYWDSASGLLYLLVESDSFADVSRPEDVPVLPPVIFETVYDGPEQ